MTEWWYGNNEIGWYRTRHEAVGDYSVVKRKTAPVDGIYQHRPKRRLEYFMQQIEAEKTEVLVNQ